MSYTPNARRVRERIIATELAKLEHRRARKAAPKPPPKPKRPDPPR